MLGMNSADQTSATTTIPAPPPTMLPLPNDQGPLGKLMEQCSRLNANVILDKLENDQGPLGKLMEQCSRLNANVILDKLEEQQDLVTSCLTGSLLFISPRPKHLVRYRIT
ncbi:hypothetical protein ANCCAN_23936 [Ancylostoma caninum]|uniref:Uncharacterized protein n=1 Tax=Ancylostoma caninum TaxID=29170 RepID=A0A368FDP0_ANCCA|nr:hypothetical protein ANCCAN_23936 [Ancylostoma caninum]